MGIGRMFRMLRTTDVGDVGHFEIHGADQQQISASDDRRFGPEVG